MNSQSPRFAQRNRGQALIGLLVVTVLLIALYMMYLGPRQGKDGERRPSVAKESIDRGNEVAMQSNISQIQMGINMYKNDNDGKPPASMEELRRYLKDYPAEMWVNPVDNKPLLYDPATGTVYAQPSTAPGTPGSVPPGSVPPGAAQPGAPAGAPGAAPGVPAIPNIPGAVVPSNP